MRDIGHFIGGKQVKGGSGRTGDVFDPNTGEVQAKVALASKSEVEGAIAGPHALPVDDAGHLTRFHEDVRRVEVVVGDILGARQQGGVPGDEVLQSVEQRAGLWRVIAHRLEHAEALAAQEHRIDH